MVQKGRLNGVIKLLHDLTLSFFLSMGVVLGGALFGSLAAYATGSLPLHTMTVLAERLKIWGLVSALGGTFFALKTIEVGLFEGQPTTVIKQLLFIASAFGGAHLGYLIILALGGGEKS